MTQLWRVETPGRSGGSEGPGGSKSVSWVVGGVLVYRCVIVGGAPIFRRWFGSELWELRADVERRGGRVALCRGALRSEVVRESSEAIHDHS